MSDNNQETPNTITSAFDPEAFKQELQASVQAALNSHSASIRKAIKAPATPLEEASLQTQIQQLKDEIAAKDRATKDLTRKAAISKYVANTINPDAATKLLDDSISKFAEVDENGSVYINKDGKVEDLKTYTTKWLETEGKWLNKGATTKAVEVPENNTKFKTTKKPTTLTDILNKLDN
jgi:hypothetical protein